MTTKPSRTTSGSAKAAATGAKVGVGKGRASRTPDASVGDIEATRTRVAGRKIPQARRKHQKLSAEAVDTVTVNAERVRADRIAVTDRLVKLGALDRDGARVLEQMITDTSQVTVSTGSGKTATLTGVLLGAPAERRRRARARRVDHRLGR